MSFVGAAVAGGIGALGSIGGAVIQGNAASSAADKQSAAAQQATALQKQMYDQQYADNSPYRQAGTQALSQMQDPSFQHSFGASDFQADPGYAFRLQQGQQALERSAAARGGIENGGMLKGLTDYAQGSASQEYQNAYSRFTNDQSNRFGRLSAIAGMGQTANGMNGAAAQNYAGQAGGNMMGAANAQGAAGIAAGNAWGGTLSGITSGVGNNVMMGQMMNRYAPQMPASPMGGGAGGGVAPGMAPTLTNTSLGGMPSFNF